MIFTFLPGILLDATLTGRSCPASVIMAGLARPGGRHTAGSGVRPQRVEWKMSIYSWKNDHLPKAFSWKNEWKNKHLRLEK